MQFRCVDDELELVQLVLNIAYVVLAMFLCLAAFLAHQQIACQTKVSQQLVLVFRALVQLLLLHLKVEQGVVVVVVIAETFETVHVLVGYHAVLTQKV
jgi:hypothetical protein